MSEQFRMDKTVFNATNATDADNHISYWKDKSYKERADAAFFLIKHAYGIDDATRMDKTIFEKRER